MPRMSRKQINGSIESLLDVIPIGIRIVRLEDGELVYANKASMEIFGCEDFERDVAGKSAFDFMPEIQPNGKKTADMAAEFFKLGAAAMDFACFKLNGQPFTARITSCNVNYRDKLSSLAITEDVTAQKRTEDALQKTLHESHKIQKELEVQRNTLQTMINSMPDFVFGKNLNFEYTLLNQSAADYLNVDKDSIIGKNDVDGLNFPIEVAEALVAQDKRIFDGEPKFVEEHWIPTHDGKERYFETMKAPIIQDGVIIGLVGTSRDITEKKQMEDALREANFNARNARAQEFISKFSAPFTQPYDFDALLNNALFELRDFTETDRAIILEFQPDGSLRCTYEDIINQETPRVLGRILEYSYEKPLLDEADKTGCFYEKEAARYFEKYPAADLGEKSFCYIPLTIGGNKLGYLVFFTMFEQANWAEGEFRLTTMAGSIIAGAYSRKMSEAVMLASKEAELRAQKFISKFSVPFTQPYDFDALINNALFELRDFTGTDRAIILELQPDSSLHCTHENVINEETPSLLGQPMLYEDKKPILDEAERTGCFYQKDAIRYLKEHAITDLGEKSFCCIPLMIEGERAGYLVFFTMFEQANWAEGEFRLATMAGSIIAGAFSNRKKNLLKEEALKAQQSSEAKSNFLSVMSHEMRTPLNAIIGMMSIAKDAQDLTRKDYALNKIKDASVSLLGIVNDVLDMAKIEADKLELSPIEYSVEWMLQKVLSVVKFRMDEKQQKFEMVMDAAIPRFIVGDDQRLSQVVTNLLTNASKFTPEGGEINLNISLQSEENRVCELRFEVSDNGIGISPEQQGKLFQAFLQAESGTSRAFGGTGLGLALCKRIVGLMGGQIWVESELGKGARFIFTVKAERGDGVNECLEAKTAQQEKPFITAARDRFYGKRLLLAEDLEINREIVMSLLDGTGINIDAAENGYEALEKIKAETGRYDLVFMDIQMPKLDGLDATRQIRSLPGEYAKRLPIIAMTANVFMDDIKKCLSAGMNGHIGKPLDMDEVMAVLKRYLA